MTAPDPSKLDQRQILQGVYDEANGRLRVDAIANVSNVSIAVDLDAAGGDNVAIKDSDGDELEINSDGSINVNIVESQPSLTKNIFDEKLAVASGASTNLVSYNVPVGKTAVLERIVVSGENIAKYEVYINSIKVDVCRTYFGSSLNAVFEFKSNDGYTLLGLDNITVTVIHNRPSSADFAGRIQVIELG